MYLLFTQPVILINITNGYSTINKKTVGLKWGHGVVAMRNVSLVRMAMEIVIAF